MEFETLKQIFVDTLDVDPEIVTPGASLEEDLGADSLDAMELNLAIEEACGYQIPDENLGELKTVSDILAFINDHINQ